MFPIIHATVKPLPEFGRPFDIAVVLVKVLAEAMAEKIVAKEKLT